MPVAYSHLGADRAERAQLFREIMGVNIVTLRKRHRWSQEALANEAGWSRQQLSRVETGQSSISVDRLLTLVEVLGVEVSDLVPTIHEIDAAVDRRRATQPT